MVSTKTLLLKHYYRRQGKRGSLNLFFFTFVRLCRCLLAFVRVCLRFGSPSLLESLTSLVFVAYCVRAPIGVPGRGVWGRVQVGGGGSVCLWKMREKGRGWGGLGGVERNRQVNAHMFVKTTL